MKRAAPIIIVLVIVVLVEFLVTRPFRQRSARDQAAQASVNTNASAAMTAAPGGNTSALLGENILRGYGDTNFPPENDLTLMARLMENSVLLLKSAANRPLSANEDWADLFRGRNSAQEKFLPDQHVALNARGQLVDRWGTPLFFHSLGSGRHELRSAGPDRKLWTADDLHRNADGSFRRGDKLNSSSLLEAAPNAQPPATGP